MSEQVNMPVRRLKALNYDEELQGKGGGENRVKLFSSEEMMERMQKKRNQKQDDRGEEEETRRRREYQQQLFMLHDGPPDDEEGEDGQKNDMEVWLESLHLKTQNIIDKCKPKASRPLAATHVATAAVRLKAKKLKNPSDARDNAAGTAENLPTSTASPSTPSDKSSSESDETPATKEPQRKLNDETKHTGDRKALIYHAKATGSKQAGHHQKREAKARHAQPSFKHRSHRQKAAHQQSDI